MSLALKITLTIITFITTNGFVGISVLGLSDDDRVLIYYAFPSIVLLLLAIIYIPIMFIWHLY